MAIKDEGARVDIAGTGGFRDIVEGKGRCDLLPIDVVEHLLIVNKRHITDFLTHINKFIREGHIGEIYTAITIFGIKVFGSLPNAILAASIQYEEGAKKYSDRNWELGIPLHSYIDSCIRHYIKWVNEDKDEPHDKAVVWNLLGLVWTYTHVPNMNDLPYKEKSKKA